MKTESNNVKRADSGSMLKLFNSKKAVNAYKKHLTENVGNMHHGFEKIAKALKINIKTAKAAWYGITPYNKTKVFRGNIGTLFILMGADSENANRKNFK